MARKTSRARKGNVKTIDFTGVESGGGGSFHIKEGKYLMKVLKVEEQESGAGNDMFKWTFEGQEKAAKGKKFFVYTTLNEEALWKLRSLLEALDQEVPDGPMDLDLDEMVDLELMGIVTDDTYEGKEVSRMNDFESLTASDEDDDDDEEDKKPSRRGAKKANTKKGKGKKLEPLDADEVKAMDEDELTEVIEKYELEVDLSEHKTPRRKASAVVTALEEIEMIAA